MEMLNQDMYALTLELGENLDWISILQEGKLHSGQLIAKITIPIFYLSLTLALPGEVENEKGSRKQQLTPRQLVVIVCNTCLSISYSLSSCN